MYQTGITWTIRLALSDDQHSRALLLEALADKPVSAVRLEPRGTDKTEIAGEVMVEFTVDDGLASLLEALHMISPQVFVARTDRPASPASPEVVSGASRHLPITAVSQTGGTGTRDIHGMILDNAACAHTS